MQTTRGMSGSTRQGWLARHLVRLLREDDGLELVEWAVVALILSALAGAYAAFQQPVTNFLDATGASYQGP